MHERIVRATIASGIVEGFTRDGVQPLALDSVRPRRRSARCASARRSRVQPWRGVRYCHGFANCAPQQRMYTATGVGKYQPMSEDCLTLNVVDARDAAATGRCR